MDKTNQKGSLADRLTIPALIIGAVVSAIGFILSFTVAPLVSGAETLPEIVAGQMVSHQLLFSQKIFYFHMPVALCSFIALFFTAFYGVRYLISKDAKYDLRTLVATEIALVFITCTMATGVPWTHFEWGVWWSWEPRLTTYLILMLLVIAYFVLRSSLVDNEKRRTYASIFGIVAFIDAPICFMITRLIPSSTHPVILRSDSGLSPDMLVALLTSLMGIALIAYGLYRLRLRQKIVSQRIAVLKNQLDEME